MKHAISKPHKQCLRKIKNCTSTIMAMSIKQFQMLILSNNMIKEEKLKSKTIWYELKAKN